MPTVTDLALPEVPGGSRGLTGVLAVPDGAGPWPGVVLVHEAYGVTDVMRRQVQHLADLGYVALMPDLYSQGGARRCLVATFRALRSGEGRAFVDLETSREFLLAQSSSTGRVGVLGFCMGGGFALVAAVDRGFDAASTNYGFLPKDEDLLLDACPVVGSYGRRDLSLRGVAGKLEAVLERGGVPHDVKEYPDAGHSFLNDGESGPAVVRLLTRRVMGAGPEPASAADAWRRIDAFFGKHLSP